MLGKRKIVKSFALFSLWGLMSLITFVRSQVVIAPTGVSPPLPLINPSGIPPFQAPIFTPPVGYCVCLECHRCSNEFCIPVDNGESCGVHTKKCSDYLKGWNGNICEKWEGELQESGICLNGQCISTGTEAWQQRLCEKTIGQTHIECGLGCTKACPKYSQIGSNYYQKEQVCKVNEASSDCTLACDSKVKGWSGNQCMAFGQAEGWCNQNAECENSPTSLLCNLLSSQEVSISGCASTHCRNENACAAGSDISHNNSTEKVCKVNKVEAKCLKLECTNLVSGWEDELCMTFEKNTAYCDSQGSCATTSLEACINHPEQSYAPIQSCASEECKKSDKCIPGHLTQDNDDISEICHLSRFEEACNDFNCDFIIKGWSGSSCMKYTTSQGYCDETGACLSSPDVIKCSKIPGQGEAKIGSCGSVACTRNDTCIPGTFIGNYTELVDICFINEDQDNCPDIDCTTTLKGWTANICEKYNAPRVGWCDVNGACATTQSLCSSVTEITAHIACGSVGCVRPNTCTPFSKISAANDELSELCFTSGQNGCGNFEACDSTGTCVTIPSASGPVMTSTPECDQYVKSNEDAVCTESGWEIVVEDLTSISIDTALGPVVVIREGTTIFVKNNVTYNGIIIYEIGASNGKLELCQCGKLSGILQLEVTHALAAGEKRELIRSTCLEEDMDIKIDTTNGSSCTRVTAHKQSSESGLSVLFNVDSNNCEGLDGITTTAIGASVASAIFLVAVAIIAFVLVQRRRRNKSKEMLRKMNEKSEHQRA